MPRSPRPDLTPEQRKLLSQLGHIGALAQQAKHNPMETTKAARAAGPGQLPYWERLVDPDKQLPELERLRMADAARRAHFRRLALKSAAARKKAS